VQQVATYVVTGTVAIGNTFTITCNTRAITGTATAATTTNAIEVLLAAISASGTAYGEFAELTFSSSTNTLTITGPDDGANFTVTGSTSGSATVTVTTTTSPTGPHHWDNVNNWIEGSVPANSDDTIIDGGPSIKYGMGQSAVTLASLTIGPNFPLSSEIGLPYNTNPTDPSSGYAQYRSQYLAISATVINVDTSSRRIRLNVGSVQTALTVNNTGNPINQGEVAFDFVGTSTSNVIRVNKGNVGIAAPAGSTSAASEIAVAFRDQQGSDATVVLGSGLTLTTLKQSGGDVTMNCAATTVTKDGGTLTRFGSGAITTLTHRSGEIYDYGTGTITTLNQVGRYFRRGLAPLTITSTYLYPDSRTRDRDAVVTWTDPPELVECALYAGPEANDQGPVCYLDVGKNRKLTIANRS
jgi:trimeric autotransporter adhesin